MTSLPTTVPELTGAIVVALIAIAFGLQKLVKQWKSVAAESSIMDLMHTELERLANQNKLLTSELNKLQIEILTLNKELRSLSIENNRLHSEVAALTAEVTRLQSVLNQHNDFKEENDDGSR